MIIINFMIYDQILRNIFRALVFLLTIIATYLSLLKPVLNAYFLMLFSLPIMALMVLRTKK